VRPVFHQLTHHSAPVHAASSSHCLSLTLLSHGLTPSASSSALRTNSKVDLDRAWLSFSFRNCFQFCDQQSLTLCCSKFHDIAAETHPAVRACSGGTSPFTSMRTKLPKKLVSRTQLGRHLQPRGSMAMPEARLFLNKLRALFWRLM